jgi:signal transduction histidine kinase
MLQRLADDATPGARVAVRVERDLPPWLTDDTAQDLFRIAQEALTNALKHAAARRIDVLLAGSDTELELTVRDDGRGFDVESSAHGLGLTSMRQRAARIAGLMRIDSAAGRGSCVRVLLAGAGPNA